MAKLESRLRADFGLEAVTASEVEFVLHGSDPFAGMPRFWESVKATCTEKNIPIYNVEKERGREQYEVALAPSPPLKTAEDTQELKEILIAAAHRFGLRADLSAKPFADEPGNGLHIHIHLQNADGKNVFFKNDEFISDQLKYSIGGLLAWLPDTMPVFAPSENSYARFADGSTAPLTVSWGANNRTTAIRLPDTAHDNKRIEHRVAGADADTKTVIAAILSAIHWGLRTRAEPPAQIYGNAALETYALSKFPHTLSDAQTRMDSSQLPIKDYLSV